MAARAALRRLRLAVRRRTPVFASVRRTTHGPFGRRLWVAVSRQTPAFGWAPFRSPNAWAPNGHGATDQADSATDQVDDPDLPGRQDDQVADLRARVRGHLHDVEVRLRELERRRPDRVRLRDARLSGSDLSGAQLPGIDLTGAQLCGADLSRAQLRDAKLEHSDLSGANLVDAALQGASLAGATLSGANLAGVVWDEATRWPEPCVRPIEDASRQLRPGVFQVRHDTARSLLSS
jgi:pentapeptide repeat protein